MGTVMVTVKVDGLWLGGVIGASIVTHFAQGSLHRDAWTGLKFCNGLLVPSQQGENTLLDRETEQLPSGDIDYRNHKPLA